MRPFNIRDSVCVCVCVCVYVARENASERDIAMRNRTYNPKV
jgi:hypothetical protein